MTDVEKSVIARYESHGEHFEILVDPALARDLREALHAAKESPKDGDDEAAEGEKKKGSGLSEEELAAKLTECLTTDAVFSDVKKGDRSPSDKVQEVFGTTEFEPVAMKIISDGEIQLTTEQRKEFTELKRRQIVEYISKFAFNPQTKTPHPPKRIELAMEDARVTIDPFQTVEYQVKGVLPLLQPLMPISMEKITIAVKLPPRYSGSAYGDVRNHSEITREEWQKDGSWIGLVKLPAGLQDEFFQRLAEKTKGEVDFKVVR